MSVEQCRDYGVVKGEILKGFNLSPKSYLERFRTMKRSGNNSNVQFLSKLKDMHRYYLDSKSITTFESLSEDIIVDQLRSVLPAETVTFVDQRRVEKADKLRNWPICFLKLIVIKEEQIIVEIHKAVLGLFRAKSWSQIEI